MSNVHQLRGGAEPYRLPPQSIELEQAVLGALLINNAAMDVVAPHIQAEHFSEALHQRIFETIGHVIGAGQNASPVTLPAFLGNHDLGHGMKLGEYLALLCANAITIVGARDYAMMIRRLATQRQLISIAGDMIEQAHTLAADASPAVIMGDVIARVHALAGEDLMRSTRHAPGIEALELIDHIERVQRGEIPNSLVSTGFDDLDAATGGYKPGDLWVLAARPGMGKTTFFVASATRAARRGAGVKGFALEVGKKQIVSRFTADLAFSSTDPISFKSIMANTVPLESLGRLREAAMRLDELPIIIDVASRLTPAEIRLRIRAEKDRMAARGVTLRVVFIDYLKQIQASDRYKGERHYEVGEISYSLKQIAKDEDLCIVLLAQLNRALEGREDKRPILSDLRESGDLEADADVVAFLHRQSVYIERSQAFRDGEQAAVLAFTEQQHRAELILGKNRSGETRTITLWLRSWDQVPAGTLPTDEVALCRLAELGRDLKAWRKIQREALWGWFACSDGRMHHATVAEGVMEAWGRKQAQRNRTVAAREARAAKRKQQSGDDDHTEDVTSSVTDTVTGSKGQRQGQGERIEAAAQLGGAARAKRIEPHDDGPAAHSEAMQACARALGDSQVADPVFGPIMLLIADGIPLAKITTVMRSEAEARRARGRPPIRTWSKWAEIVVERLGAAPKVAPQAASAEPRVDFGGGFTMAEGTLRSVIDNGQWLPQFGGRPGEASCKVPERFWPAATKAA